ncbi:hypothetical protein DMI80_07315 [Akkermansia muciniphila]|nr:hypothetical protein DMI78_07310 [Akkermansia muciniphila]QHV70625.1 hypothetical protein DMI80_07315 [Akkermansia muciniphila]QHV73081.1 hypothetical protein DMI81_07320 [Akkermansia muciniphila]
MYKVMINPIIKLVCVVISSLLIMTSCNKSSSNEDGNNSEAPLTLEGKTLTGGMYVDYQEGDGWELEAKDFVFSTRTVTFGAVEYDANDHETTRTITGSYVFEKTGTNVGTLQIESNWIGFHLNLTFNGGNVAAEGTMKENMGKELPAKGTFNKR